MASYLQRAKIAEGQTATGTSASHTLTVPSGTITVEAAYTEGSGTTCTGLVIDLEGSVTGNNWFALASHTFTSAERTAKAAMFHVVDKPVMFIRTNITTLTKTGANAVTVSISILSA